MLEALAWWNEDIAEGVFAFQETVERSTTAIISPGVRHPFNLPNDAQLVIGAALHHRYLRLIRLGHVLLLLIRACVPAIRSLSDKITRPVNGREIRWKCGNVLVLAVILSRSFSDEQKIEFEENAIFYSDDHRNQTTSNPRRA
jgi:hypothetical protein